MRTSIFAAIILAMPSLATARAPHQDGLDEGPPPIEEVMDQIKEKYPEKWAYLQGLRESDPRTFHQHVQKIHRHMMRGQHNPEAHERMKKIKELRAEFKEKVTAFNAATEKDQDAIREELEALAGKIFDQKQEARKSRLENAKSRIDELEKEIDARDKKRKELIEQFVDTATGDTLQGL